MSVTKKIARKIVLPLMYNLGADNYYLNRSDRSCCIINFHGVRKNTHEVFNNRHLISTEFEKIIRYLSKKFNVVPLSEIFDMHRNGTKPLKKTVSLTFDDGYKNNFEVALPILKKYNTPATFYLISKGLVDEKFYAWPDKIDIIKKFYGKEVSVNKKIFSPLSYFNTELKSELLDYVKTLGQKADKTVNELDSEINIVNKITARYPELLELINGSDLLKFKSEPLLEIASHTHSHPSLEFLNSEELKYELRESKRVIEQIIGKQVTSLAFPDGSYNEQVLDTALASGYTNLVAVSYKYKENNENPNLLSRFTISNSTTFESNVIRLAKDFDKFGFN